MHRDTPKGSTDRREPAIGDNQEDSRRPETQRDEHEGATEQQVGDRTGPGAGHDIDSPASRDKRKPD
jgi:hypothetical protein